MDPISSENQGKTEPATTQASQTTQVAPKKQVSQELLDRLARAREAAAKKREDRKAQKQLAVETKQKLKDPQPQQPKPVPEPRPEPDSSSTDSSDTSDSEDEEPQKRSKPQQGPSIEIEKIKAKYRERYKRRYKTYARERTSLPPAAQQPPEVAMDVHQASRVLAKNRIQTALTKELLSNTMRGLFGA